MSPSENVHQCRTVFSAILQFVFTSPEVVYYDFSNIMFFFPSNFKLSLPKYMILFKAFDHSTYGTPDLVSGSTGVVDIDRSVQVKKTDNNYRAH